MQDLTALKAIRIGLIVGLLISVFLTIILIGFKGGGDDFLLLMPMTYVYGILVFPSSMAKGIIIGGLTTVALCTIEAFVLFILSKLDGGVRDFASKHFIFKIVMIYFLGNWALLILGMGML